MYHRYDGGWIELICGSMFSGKTEELIRRLRRAQIARQHPGAQPLDGGEGHVGHGAGVGGDLSHGRMLGVSVPPPSRFLAYAVSGH